MHDTNFAAQGQEQKQELVLRYLYGDLTLVERAAFEHQVEHDPVLGELLESEQHFQQLLPRGTTPVIDAERVAGNRYLLRNRLRLEAAPRVSFWQSVKALFMSPRLLAAQALALAVTFFIGLQLSDTNSIDDGVAQAASPLDLLSEADYEIASLRINNYDETTGAIDLSFALVADSTIRANIADAGVRGLMISALEDGVESAARLDTVAALGDVNHLPDVSQSLIYLLTSDQNPGVRVQAVGLLVELAQDEKVRDALRLALQQDVNPGVRLEAFAALASDPDAETLAVFRERMVSDDNEYIRARARAIVESPALETKQI